MILKLALFITNVYLHKNLKEKRGVTLTKNRSNCYSSSDLMSDTWKKRLSVLGAGGYGKVVREIALSLFNIDGKPLYEAVDFLDDNFVDSMGRIADLKRYKGNCNDVFVELEITQYENSCWIRLG